MNDYRAAAGDLTDIVHARAPPTSEVEVASLPSSSLTVSWGDFGSISPDTDVLIGEDFGDPFSEMGDPLLCEGDEPRPFMRPLIAGQDEGRKETIGGPSPCGLPSHMLQINAAPSVVIPRGDLSYTTDTRLLMSNVAEERGNRGGMMQISSPRNNSGMKRRKSQAKKVVCIPVPAAANSRPSSGEVVPSDLWAWRKYGQKPIKGSPFPRGYYKCSSSKGCSARKQVERSRTDPNMLVITYTSEHNHPRPSHHNALAGSTRSTSKGNLGSKSSANGSRTPKPGVVKWEEQNRNCSDDNLSSTVTAAVATAVKGEMDEAKEKQFDVVDPEFVGVGLAHCYWPSLMDGLDHHLDDFFADLGEIEANPYELLFKKGFPSGDDRDRGNKWVDPFNPLDWGDENKGAASFWEAANNTGLWQNPNVR
ncbi:hypothetical protein MLD38_010144 [Melastoma candidum]|uniref:Uncharacterized protein n=1 Tax=Melastoma candidum TaxID=119954 RepID=A0ACB9R791_9MYRT|nr:hypothetical protein MLD38_010144 [Melastoma candidum]